MVLLHRFLKRTRLRYANSVARCTWMMHSYDIRCKIEPEASSWFHTKCRTHNMTIEIHLLNGRFACGWYDVIVPFFVPSGLNTVEKSSFRFPSSACSSPDSSSSHNCTNVDRYCSVIFTIMHFCFFTIWSRMNMSWNGISGVNLPVMSHFVAKVFQILLNFNGPGPLKIVVHKTRSTKYVPLNSPNHLF